MLQAPSSTLIGTAVAFIDSFFKHFYILSIICWIVFVFGSLLYSVDNSIKSETSKSFWSNDSGKNSEGYVHKGVAMFLDRVFLLFVPHDLCSIIYIHHIPILLQR